jgi:hypothetical protein
MRFEADGRRRLLRRMRLESLIKAVSQVQETKMESVGALKDQKELLSARIDELEIAMISARGQKLTRLATELDSLEEQKQELKRKIKALSAAAPAPLTTLMELPAQRLFELETLEAELRELERLVEEKEDEERRVRFELDSRKKELASQEAALWEREQRVLRVTMDSDPVVKHAVRLQRLRRAIVARRNWRGPVPVLRPVVERYLESEEAKPWLARWQLLLDVCRSEDQYAAGLVTVRDKYALPLRKTNSTVSGAAREDIQDMFGTLEVLATFEEDVARALHQRIFSRFSHPSVGDVFLKLSSVFAIYVEYCRGLDATFAVMARLQKTPLFGAYVEKLFLASGSRAPLTTLMELPAQRLFQVEVILGALAQLTPVSHGDCSRLRSAHKAVAEAVAEVKGLQEERKAHQKLAAMARKIQGLPESVIAPGRKLLLEQEVTLVDRKRVLHRLFLFGDCVVVTSVSGKSLKFVEQLPLVGLRLNSLPDTESVYNCFELQSMTRVLQYVCDTFEAKSHLEEAFFAALRLANSNALLDGERPGARGMPERGRSQTFTLQRVRLESETKTAAESVARLPREALENLRQKKYEGVARVLEEEAEALLTQLDREALVLAAQVLDANGELSNVARAMCRALVVAEPSAASLTSRLQAEEPPLICRLGTAAAAATCRPWLAAMLGKHVVAMKQRRAPEEVARAILADAVAALRDVPPHLVCFVGLLHHQALQKMRDGAELIAAVYFGTAFLVGALQWPLKFGLTDGAEDIPETYVLALQKALATEAPGMKKAVVAACSGNYSALAPSVSKARCESDVLPAMVQVLIRDIEEIHSERMIRALAMCIVLK